MNAAMKSKLSPILGEDKSGPNSQSRRDIDDHDGTPIGQGITVAILAAKLTINGSAQLAKSGGESELQQGVFARDAT